MIIYVQYPFKLKIKIDNEKLRFIDFINKYLFNKLNVNEILAVKFNKKIFHLLDYILISNKVVNYNILELIIYGHKDFLNIIYNSIAFLFSYSCYKLFLNNNIKFYNLSLINNGFFYDIDMNNIKISNKNFIFIEDYINNILYKKDKIFYIFNKNIEKNKNLFQIDNDFYKKNILNKISQFKVYKIKKFLNLIPGVCFLKFNKKIYFKIISNSGVYLYGNKKNKMIQRIYCIVFLDKIEMNKFLDNRLNLKKIDHRILGKKLKMFSIIPSVGVGLPFWLNNGFIIRRIIENYIIDKEIEYGYQHVNTPILANLELYKISGHFFNYKEYMFPIMKFEDKKENVKLVLRPMNCPHHIMLYKQERHSYKELPIRIAELGMMHRYEKSGSLSGLQRVREMTLNDAHIFVCFNEIKKEVKNTIKLILEVYKDFDIKDYYFCLSSHDDLNNKYIDDKIMWNKSEKLLKDSMKELNIKYIEKKGDAAFYGPKLDIQVNTVLGLEETLSTIQLDFLLPKRFNLSYIEKNNYIKSPIIIHRSVISTMERFLAYLIEYYKGVFPIWLSPIQVIIIPILNDEILKYSEIVKNKLKFYNIRVKIDKSNENINQKIRISQINKIPYQIVIGNKELVNKMISVRKYNDNIINFCKLDLFIKKILLYINKKK